jgi:magnesium-transporting ATPase (P-type)
MKFKTLPPEDVYRELGTSESGLGSDEVEKRLTEYGLNQIEEVKQKPLILKFAANLYQLLALLLWGASALAFISGTPQLGLQS